MMKNKIFRIVIDMAVAALTALATALQVAN